MEETCIIRETPDAGICGETVHEHLRTSYTFDSGQSLEFSFGMCVDHYNALLSRLESDDFAAFSVN